MIATEYESVARLAIAALIGLGVGVEREWSGHTIGPDARFAGVRTFFLLGLLGGGAGLIASNGYAVMAAAIIAGGAALSVSAYVVATRRETAGVDGTTEAAALTVLLLSTMSGLGFLALAAGAGSVVVLALSEKTRLHALVRHIGDVELHAALQFTVLALVVLPLLPPGPLFGALAIRPRALWMVVLLFSGLNFAGYIARRAAGVQRGYGITGALGGIVSSTAVTLNFSRQSQAEVGLGTALARGVIAACTVLVPRVLIVSALINPDVAVALGPRLLPQFALGLALVVFAWRRHDSEAGPPAPSETANPLHIGNALKMTIAFQAAISIIAFVGSKFGTTGLYGTAAALGLTDVDALTVSMSSPSSLLAPSIAARALAVGILANTLLKLSLTVILGRRDFRRTAAAGLTGLAVASAAGVLFV